MYCYDLQNDQTYVDPKGGDLHRENIKGESPNRRKICSRHQLLHLYCVVVNN